MNRPLRTAALLLVPLAMVACTAEPETSVDGTAPAAEMTGATVDLAAEEQAIRARVDAWELAANESAEAFASFYTSDGVLMPPNGPPAQGPAAIAEAMGPMFDVVENITFETATVEIARSGELAVERGSYTLRGTMPDGTAFDDEGSYLVAWEKQDGQWMVIHDIFNSDRPAPGS